MYLGSKIVKIFILYLLKILSSWIIFGVIRTHVSFLADYSPPPLVGRWNESRFRMNFQYQHHIYKHLKQRGWVYTSSSIQKKTNNVQTIFQCYKRIWQLLRKWILGECKEGKEAISWTNFANIRKRQPHESYGWFKQCLESQQNYTKWIIDPWSWHGDSWRFNTIFVQWFRFFVFSLACGRFACFIDKYFAQRGA